MKFLELKETSFDDIPISDQIEEWPYSDEFNTEPKILELYAVPTIEKPLEND